MDKTVRFTPSREEACKMADDYWKELTQDREEFLDMLNDLIKSTASMGSYSITQRILKNDKEFIKEKLEDVGYIVSFSEISNDNLYDYIRVSFK